ncbi:hypothetical protein D0Y65_033640, partial [Glycine soja]
IHATTSKYFKARYDKFVKEVSSYLKKTNSFELAVRRAKRGDLHVHKNNV